MFQATPFAERFLSDADMSLIELYQRQDALSTQHWLHYLLVNALLVAFTWVLRDKWQFSPGETLIQPGLLIPAFCLLIWGTFTYGSFTTIRHIQAILLFVARQIEGKISDKTALFSGSTRSVQSVSLFHVIVDAGVFFFCAYLYRLPPSLCKA